MRYIVQRYLGANFLMPFFVSCFFFVSFLLTFNLFKLTRLVINKGVELSLIFQIIYNLSLSLIPIAIPIAIFFSCLFSLNKLSSDCEFMAMRSFGFSLHRLFVPYFCVSFVIALFIFILNMDIIPKSRYDMKVIMDQLGTKGVLTDIKPGQFFTDIPDVTVYAKEVGQQGRLLSQVFIYTREKESENEKVIFANSGYLLNEIQAGGKVLYKLKLVNGNLAKTVAEDNNIEKIVFDEYILPLNQRNLNTRSNNVETFTSLYQSIKNQQKEQKPKTKKTQGLIRSELEFFDKINLPLICLVFTLLGFSLGIQKSRGKGPNTAVISFVVLVSYYALFFAGVSFAKKLMIPTAFASFFPTILCLIIGLRLYKKLDWVS